MNKAVFKRVIGFISAVLLVAYFVGDRLIFFTPGGSLERGSSYFVYPVLYMQNAVVRPLQEHFKRRRTVEELTLQLSKLEKERDAALADNIQLNALVDYDQNISELIDFKKRYLTPQAFITHVIAKQFSDQAHYFLVDAGERKGVKPDMVAVYNNCLVGKVVEVYPWYSKVMLISDKNCKVASMCATTKVNGIFQGANTLGHGQLNRISHLACLTMDDLVLSSGEGMLFPKGYGVGKIRSFQVQGLFYQVEIEPLIDLRELKYCCLIERDGSSLVQAAGQEGVLQPKNQDGSVVS